ncbi:unnamed protein product [Toxocara canis]|uniref:Uncharacterized protein n=1 Tax=Toxocara canis TaxID=6265 RepID=A0A3P7FP52_TOXCA|nr:unnamed protein product [Toxocara canis]
MKSLRWIDVSDSLNDVRYTDQITQFASDTGQMISLVFRTWSDDDCELSVRLIRSPFVMPSLYSIANFQLRKCSNINVLKLRRRYVLHLRSSNGVIA